MSIQPVLISKRELSSHLCIIKTQVDMIRSIQTAFLLLLSTVAFSQSNPTSALRGTITDAQSGFPLPGVNVIVIDTDPVMGAMTDTDGNYRLENVPVGRHTVKVTFFGYEPQVLSNLLVLSGKELEVNAKLQESIMQLEGAEIVAEDDKFEPLNKMATVSARSFTIEEAMRYSGSLQDPSRMAQNYAGVSNASDDRNDIIVRGNSPSGVLWRMEGIDIPSPNHFSTLGGTGGPVSMLNINNLSNSDFLTSAFPAEYGNALAGVFEIPLILAIFAPLLFRGIMNDNVKIFCGTASGYLAKNIALECGTSLGEVNVQRFSDGELQTSIEETVRGKDVFIVQSTFPPADNLMELLLMVDAAKRASAKRIIAVMPYFGYARQDRKDKPRVAIGAKLVANLLTAAGVDRVITMDLHADQIQGFFEVPVDHLFASTIFLPYLESLDADNLIIATPDTGGTKRANAYAKFLSVDLAICYKQRKVANQVESMTVIGDVKGKDVVLIDDMCDTAGTLTKAADMMMEQGAKSVRAVCTHAILSGPAYERIAESQLTELIVTNSIPLKEGKPQDKIKVLGTAPLFSNVMRALTNNESISSQFLIS